MQLKAPPFFFIIRINKGIQKETRSMDGHLAISTNYVFMQHETQHGEIVDIGKQAKNIFPTVKKGDILLFHHFVTGKGIEDREDSPYLIYSDNDYNYYLVTVASYNGERNLTYGVWDGSKILPHKDFIFLEVPKIKKEAVVFDHLIEIKNWSESRDKKGDKMKEIKNTIGELTKSNVSIELKSEIEKREKEMTRISKEVNKKQIQLYKVAFSNYGFSEVGMLDLACNTKISFMGTEYIIAPTKYLYFGTSAN